MASLDVAAGGASLTLNGSLSGGGQVNIGSGSDLTVEGAAATSTGPITFQGTGDVLTLYSSALNGSDVFTPTLSGFNASDAIDFHGTVTSTSYDSGDGVLTLFDGATAVAFLTLSGDYSGDSFSVAAIGGGVTQIVDPPAVTATVANGGTLVVNTASNETIDFAGGTGKLVLDQPQNFNGQIVGFTGTAPDAAHSDVIDLAGINYDSSHFSEAYNTSTDILTVSDGTHTAYLAFEDFKGTFDFASDGKGGTIILDPPAAGAKDAPSAVTTAAGNDHVTAQAHQNGTDHAAGPANEGGLGGDQSSVLTLDMNSSGDPAPATSALAPAPGAHVLGGGALASAMSNAAFGGDVAVVSSAAGEASAGNAVERIARRACPVALVIASQRTDWRRAGRRGHPGRRWRNAHRARARQHAPDGFDDRRWGGLSQQRGRAFDGANGPDRRARRGAPARRVADDACIGVVRRVGQR